MNKLVSNLIVRVAEVICRERSTPAHKVHVNGMASLAKSLFLCVSLLMGQHIQVCGQVVISEFLAVNSGGLRDEDGESSDWIELYNSSSEPVELAGWYLTDDAANLTKWAFPNVTLNSGQYLVVFASDKNRTNPAAQLHTNFKLTSAGEYLGLVQTNGTTIEWHYSPTFPPQSQNVSYGINPSSGLAEYYSTPTPGVANSTGLTNVLAPVTVSHGRGFYDSAFQVSLACASSNVTIRYTLDGSAPTASSGTIYSSPIPISTTTVLRALAYRSGYLSQPVATHTYIFADHVLNQPTNPPGYPAQWTSSVSAWYGMYPNYPDSNETLKQGLLALPSVCISGSIDDIFGSATGYYNHGSKGNNDSWEKPGSIELIYPDGNEGFQANAGVLGRANGVSSARKRGLRVEFKSIYGATKLKFPGLFDGAKEGRDSASDEFDALIIRPGHHENYTATSYNPVRNIYFRDVMMRDVQIAVSGYGDRNLFVHLYLNGLYWGVYNLTEVYNKDFLADYFGGKPEDWFDVSTKDMGPAPNDGKAGLYDKTDIVGTNRWLSFLHFMDTADLSQPTNYLHAAQEVTPRDFAEYIIYYSYYGVGDWPDNNWNFGMRNGPNPGPGFFLVWDAEKTWLQNDDPQSFRHARYSPYLIQGSGNPKGALYRPAINRIWWGYIQNAEFRMLFADRSYELMHNGGLLTDSNRVERFMYYVNLLNLPIRIDQKRWGADNRRNNQPGVMFTYTDVQAEINRVLSNTENNVSKYIASFRAHQLYPSIDPPLISITASNETSTTCTLSGGSGSTVYYTVNGTDPRLLGGGVSPDALTYVIGGGGVSVLLSDTSLVKARSWQAGEWSALNWLAVSRPNLHRIIFSEIMYNPPMFNGVDGDAFEFLELKNVGSVPVNLRGMTFTRGLTFTFNTDLVLAPGAFAVLVSDATNFVSKYPGVQIAGVYTGKLANNGETLELRDVAGGIVASVKYDDKSPWPESADNGGYSLVPISTADQFDASDATLWRASRNPGGSPGAEDPAPFSDVLISEILARPHSPQKDSIELHNASAQPVNVSGWSLTDNELVPDKFIIPPGTPPIPAGGYLVFNEDNFNPTPGVPPSFALSSLGESVHLFAPDGAGRRLVHSVKFKASTHGVSFGLHTLSTGGIRHPAQTSVTLGTTNSGPRNGPVVINEIMYHPIFPAGTEFIELLNVSTSSVVLFDPANPGNTWRINGASFQFPTNVTLGVGEYLLVVDTSPAQFRAQYGIPTSVQIFGPMGRLGDTGETLELQRPDSPQLDPTTGLFFAPRITVDEVSYRNASPWPTRPAGTGYSLSRVHPLAFGDDPINWAAATPTPGAANVVDTDGDGLPDDVELRYGLNPANGGDAWLDLDGDGRTNLEEWISGTALNDPADVLHLEITHSSPGLIQLAFPAKPGRRYQVQVSEQPGGAEWIPVQEISPVRGGRFQLEQPLSANAARFYRLAVNAHIPLMPPPPTFTLTTSAANGSIALNPPGGVYTTGMVVSVTANANPGFTFSHWSGDLTGSVNPANLTMNGNHSVTANFLAIPNYTLTTSASNGSVTLNPPGGIYDSGTVVTVTANPNIGYKFGNWSGDLVGSVNPTTITMNGNKSVTANFSALPPGSMNVLFVVGASGNNPSDLAISNRLQQAGYTVQMILDNASTTGDATGKGLVIVSSTVGSANVTTKFRDVTVPVINWETGLQDDFGFANTSGNTGSQTNLNLTNPGHPLAGGLSAGIHTVATNAGDFSWGEPGGNPIIIARLNGGSTNPCIYAYETGAVMAVGTAPARRVHLFLQNNTFVSLNANGLSLFDAAVSWAVGQVHPQ
jgi:hypothetical protein